jgi:TolB-like protein/tetratricopeptide (TPR) repeat protein
MSILRELQRRNVLRVAAGYIAVSWLIVQVMDTLSDAFTLTGEHIRVAVIVLAVCFIPVMIISWAFELTPDGLKRDADVARDTPAAQQSKQRLDRIVTAALAIALAYFVIDEIFIETSEPLTEAERSIAVLPFVNMSDDPSQEYFSDGISEEMLNLLASIPELRVISRTSAFQYKNTDLEIPEIAAQLRVAHVVEGSVRKAGNTVRITAQLIHAPTDTHVWSETWDRELDDIFAIQDEIAARVVDRLRVDLVGPTPHAETVDPEAYMLFLQADHIMAVGLPSVTHEESIARATDLLERALEIEPDYVDALNELALAYWRTWANFGGRRPDDPLIAKVMALNEKAYALDPDDPTALAYRGYALAAQPGKTAEAAALFEKALTLGPTNEDAVRVGLSFARSIGRLDTAMRIGEFNTNRDPRCVTCFYQLSQVYRDARMFEKAREAGQIAEALGMRLDFSLARTSLLQGNPEPMIALWGDQDDEHWQSVSYLAMALFTAGRKAESDALMERLIELFGESNPFAIASAWAWRGNADEAFEWLDRALLLDRLQVVTWNRSPEFEPLYEDPRWDEFLRGIERHPDQLATIRFDPRLPD